MRSQGKVINVQPGFLGWFLTKNHPGMEQIGGNSGKTILGLSVQSGNSGKTILGLSVQGRNRYGSTLVLSNKNHVEVIIIFILQHGFCEQHGFYTIPTLDVRQSQDGFYTMRMGYC